jgi:hypothetical protein
LGDQFQGSDAPFLLNQGISDFAFWDFPITFQDNFFGNNEVNDKIPWSLHTAYSRDFIFLLWCMCSAFWNVFGCQDTVQISDYNDLGYCP